MEDNFSCSVCAISLDSGLYEVLEHPSFPSVGVCQACWENITGAIADKEELICCWCADEGDYEIYICDNCSCNKGFCHSCIVYCFGEEEAKNVKEAEFFECYSCDMKKIEIIQKRYLNFIQNPCSLYRTLHCSDSTEFIQVHSDMANDINKYISSGVFMNEIYDKIISSYLYENNSLMPSKKIYLNRVRELISCLESVLIVQHESSQILDDEYYWTQVENDIIKTLRGTDGSEPSLSDVEFSVMVKKEFFETRFDKTVAAVEFISEKLENLQLKASEILIYVENSLQCKESYGSNDIEGCNNTVVDNIKQSREEKDNHNYANEAEKCIAIVEKVYSTSTKDNRRRYIGEKLLMLASEEFNIENICLKSISEDIEEFIFNNDSIIELPEEKLKMWNISDKCSARILQSIIRYMKTLIIHEDEDKLLPGLLPAVEFEQMQKYGKIDQKSVLERARNLTLKVRMMEQPEVMQEIQNLLENKKNRINIKVDQSEQSGSSTDAYVDESTSASETESNDNIVVEDLGGNGPNGFDPEKKSSGCLGPHNEKEAEILLSQFEYALMEEDKKFKQLTSSMKKTYLRHRSEDADKRTDKILGLRSSQSQSEKIKNKLLRKKSRKSLKKKSHKKCNGSLNNGKTEEITVLKNTYIQNDTMLPDVKRSNTPLQSIKERKYSEDNVEKINGTPNAKNIDCCVKENDATCSPLEVTTLSPREGQELNESLNLKNKLVIKHNESPTDDNHEIINRKSVQTYHLIDHSTNQTFSNKKFAIGSTPNSPINICDTNKCVDGEIEKQLNRKHLGENLKPSPFISINLSHNRITEKNDDIEIISVSSGESSNDKYFHCLPELILKIPKVSSHQNDAVFKEKNGNESSDDEESETKSDCNSRSLSIEENLDSDFLDEDSNSQENVSKKSNNVSSKYSRTSTNPKKMRILPKRNTKSCLICKDVSSTKWVQIRRKKNTPKIAEYLICDSGLCYNEAMLRNYVDVDKEIAAARKGSWWEFITDSDYRSESDEDKNSEYNEISVKTRNGKNPTVSKKADSSVTPQKSNYTQIKSRYGCTRKKNIGSKNKDASFIDLANSSSDDSLIQNKRSNSRNNIMVSSTDDDSTSECSLWDEKITSKISSDKAANKNIFIPLKKKIGILKNDEILNDKKISRMSNPLQKKSRLNETDQVKNSSPKVNEREENQFTIKNKNLRMLTRPYGTPFPHVKMLTSIPTKSNALSIVPNALNVSASRLQRKLKANVDTGLKIIACQIERIDHDENPRIKRKREDIKMNEEDNDHSLIFAIDNGVTIKGSIAKHLKSHQRDGIKFMYHNIIKSAEDLKSELLESNKKTYRNAYPKNVDLTKETGGCILAHCMGLGKSLQVISLLSAIFRSNKLRQIKKENGEPRLNTVLIVSPVNVIQNWEQEFEKWGVKEIDCSVETFHLSDSSKSSKEFRRLKVFKNWYEGELGYKKNRHQQDINTGRVLILGYQAIVSLHRNDLKQKGINEVNDVFTGPYAKIADYLFKKGPDILIVDEAHFLKNEKTEMVQAMERIATKRRIMLTGSPLQNNLMEYYVMVNYVRPGLLRNQQYYRKTYFNPISNGTHADATQEMLSTMKRRVYTLKKKIEPFVHRVDSSVLRSELQKEPQAEYVIGIDRSEKQIDMERRILLLSCKSEKVTILKAIHALQFVWLHHSLGLLIPSFEQTLSKKDIEVLDAEIAEIVENIGAKKKIWKKSKELPSSEDEWISISSDSDEQSQDEEWSNEQTDFSKVFEKTNSDDEYVPTGRINSSSSSGVGSRNSITAEKTYQQTNSVQLHTRSSDLSSYEMSSIDRGDSDSKQSISINETDPIKIQKFSTATQVKGKTKENSKKRIIKSYCEKLKKFSDQHDTLDINTLSIAESGKLVILLEIIAQSILAGDKVVLFSKYRTVLNFLQRLFGRPQGWGECVSSPPPPEMGPTWGPWKESKDFYRIDGNVTARLRQIRINEFNEEGNKAHLFMLSTTAGINLVAANRIILVDSSWNPAADLQAMYRCYRFGQKKEVAIYRLISHKSVEEKIYMLQTWKRSLSDTLLDGKHIRSLFSSRNCNLSINPYRRKNKLKPEAKNFKKFCLDSIEDVVQDEALDDEYTDLDNADEEDGLMNVLKRQKEMDTSSNQDDVVKDVVLSRVLSYHGYLIKTCHQNKKLLMHDPNQRLRPEEELQAELEEKTIENALDFPNGQPLTAALPPTNATGPQMIASQQLIDLSSSPPGFVPQNMSIGRPMMK